MRIPISRVRAPTLSASTPYRPERPPGREPAYRERPAAPPPARWTVDGRFDRVLHRVTSNIGRVASSVAGRFRRDNPSLKRAQRLPNDERHGRSKGHPGSRDEYVAARLSLRARLRLARCATTPMISAVEPSLNPGPDLLANRVSIRRQLLCKRLIDHGDLRRFPRIRFSKRASANYRNAKRFEVARRHRAARRPPRRSAVRRPDASAARRRA